VYFDLGHKLLEPTASCGGKELEHAKLFAEGETKAEAKAEAES